MALNSVRNYLHERNVRLRYEWKQFQIHDEDPQQMSQLFETKDFVRIYHGSRNKLTEREQMKILQSESDKIKQSFLEKNLEKKEPFEYYTDFNKDLIPENRIPQPGIELLPFKFHKGRTVSANETVTEEGYPLHPLLKVLITQKYPQFLNAVNEYCRPLGTTDATFKDFNKEQIPTSPFTEEDLTIILPLVTRLLDARPYQPVHFIDTLYAGMPLQTGTGYHNRHSFKINSNAKYSHPLEYADKPTSKGYYINASLDINRTLVHRIKYTGVPFDLDHFLQTREYTDENLTQQMANFLRTYPTMMFTRNHVSKRNEPLKQRPVYAVDELFLIIECMLTFPLHVQARKMSCAIMYSLETIRGSNVYLDKVAQNYQSFATFDWSSFDQTIPFPLVKTFWYNFLPQLLIVNQGYHATYEYPTHPTTTSDRMAMMMNNLIEFLFYWYTNMTFLSQDGFAYKREFAGIPSGLLNTQYLDSYCNLFVIIHAMLDFGITPTEILQVRFFIMGDDNSIFTHWPITKLQMFSIHLERFAKTRYNMKLNIAKTVVTDSRQHIQTLSYECNFGSPRRPIGKLLAQLCYPEHGHIDKYMSMRAIGIAYASCGQDRTFYNLCKDVFNTFLPYAQPLTTTDTDKLRKYLPGIFKMMDEPPSYLFELSFPTFQNIVDEVSTWKGELSSTPKWNFSHFIHSPDYSSTDFQTLETYNKTKNQ